VSVAGGQVLEPALAAKRDERAALASEPSGQRGNSL
jgi:hypothetical protein